MNMDVKNLAVLGTTGWIIRPLQSAQCLGIDARSASNSIKNALLYGWEKQARWGYGLATARADR
jgi:hypothetical protein